jgi:hypothetical protein
MPSPLGLTHIVHLHAFALVDRRRFFFSCSPVNGKIWPQDINEKNWIQTLRGKAFMVALRLYGSETVFFDQTWKPDDVVKVK